MLQTIAVLIYGISWSRTEKWPVGDIRCLPKTYLKFKIYYPTAVDYCPLKSPWLQGRVKTLISIFHHSKRILGSDNLGKPQKLQYGSSSTWRHVLSDCAIGEIAEDHKLGVQLTYDIDSHNMLTPRSRCDSVAIDSLNTIILVCESEVCGTCKVRRKYSIKMSSTKRLGFSILGVIRSTNLTQNESQ